MEATACAGSPERPTRPRRAWYPVRRSIPGFMFMAPSFMEPSPWWFQRIVSIVRPKNAAPHASPAPFCAPIAPVVPALEEFTPNRPEKIVPRMVIQRDAYPGFDFTAPCPGDGDSDPTSDDEEHARWTLGSMLRRLFPGSAHRRAKAITPPLNQEGVVSGPEDNTSRPSSIVVLSPLAVKVTFPPPKSKRAAWRLHTRGKIVLDGQYSPGAGRGCGVQLVGWASNLLKSRLAFARYRY
ncbi:hypothetical protein B0H19DRAFT_173180 [Mycena capillaripes]|nr:hypothetical protein B0H19DRAFT_173180 [Mycena capillaripes]